MRRVGLRPLSLLNSPSASCICGSLLHVQAHDPASGRSSATLLGHVYVYMRGEVCPSGEGPGVWHLETSLGLGGQGTLESRVPEGYSRF